MIIRSLLDTDLYKFTMMQVVLHQFASAQVQYRFRCRTPGVDFAPFVQEIEREVDALCELRLNEDELKYLSSLPFIKSDFIDFLRLFRLPRQSVVIANGDLPGELSIVIQGSWLHTILFEVPVLAIINEVYFRHHHPKPDYELGRARLFEKIEMVKQATDLPMLRVIEYGTRRRFSHTWQDAVIKILKSEMGASFVGTSNVYMAKCHKLAPIGTMGHEHLQACQALGPRLRDSQVFAFEAWAKEYRGDLGIALSDVYGLDVFLRDFDMYLCKLFDGARHDSGDPFEWGERIIDHYQDNGVDPRTKTLVFSDGLTFPQAIEIARRFVGRIQVAFGIGTNLTNDLGYKPLQIVIKMTQCNGQPVAKVSDEPSKTMCDDPAYLAYLKHVFELH